MGENYQYQNEQELSLLNEPIPLYGLTKIAIIRQGLSFMSITSVLDKTGLTRQELANILQVSVRTLQRHDTSAPLSSAVSEKLLRLNDLYHLAAESLGKVPNNITKWLRTPNVALGSEKPLNLLDTYYGLKQVENVLGRLAHGVYS